MKRLIGREKEIENQVSFILNRSLGLEVLNTARSNLKIITRSNNRFGFIRL